MPPLRVFANAEQGDVGFSAAFGIDKLRINLYLADSDQL